MNSGASNVCWESSATTTVPRRGVTLSAFGLQKEVFVATSAWIDMGVDLTRSVVYWNEGYLKDGIWTLFPGLVLTSMVGSFIGKRILSSLSQTHFEKVVIALVMIIGSATLIHALLN